MMNDTDIPNTMDDFELAWRFTDPNYNVLARNELLRIIPNNSADSLKEWGFRVSSIYKHISQIDLSLFGELVNRFSVDSDNETLGRESLIKNISLNLKDEILFFWSPKYSVKTDWELVLKYWTDFFYPSDGNTVLISKNYIIVFSEENFLVYKNYSH